ncbi:MAG: hypothetical protein EOP90_05490 [Lysobacteraceae bacterium]|nr:MAG: hypothetical protein EOP90_05490 [Xanthomonadaceae bacterium]
MRSTTTFKLYRYQLLPIDRHTADLYEGLTTAQLIERKNDIFAQAIPFVARHTHRGVQLAVQVEGPESDAFVLRIAPRRALIRETPEFQLEHIENWPHVTAIVLNRPDEQLLAVQDKPIAFTSTNTVVRLIQSATRAMLERAGLRLHIESLFSRENFWGLIKQYKGRVTWIEFELVTPNMANISNTLAEEFKTLAKDTNASQSNVQLRSDPDSALNIEPNDPQVKGLVDYASEGGGDISVKIRGLRKRIHTSSAVRETEMDDLQLTGPTAQVAGILRGLLK